MKQTILDLQIVWNREFTTILRFRRLPQIIFGVICGLLFYIDASFKIIF